MAVFDHLIANGVRWQGDAVSPLLWTRGEEDWLLLDHQHTTRDKEAPAVFNMCIFRASTYNILREFLGPGGTSKLGKAVQVGAFRETVNMPSEVKEAIEERHLRVVRHVEGCVERYAAETVLLRT
eukprot:TRINITY_DN7712_c0_g1_i1.p1 TRINITY_DN7712_c0_g1~~TRINITY_DN7712_c0_g1_i1.p1  ORF type:complete len:139 (+),score=35.13 TRINITY_DN7712_c0_g1_i1:43-417(+)